MSDERIKLDGDPALSLARLVAAGVVEEVTLDPRTGKGRIRFTEPVFRLLQAGRPLHREPGFAGVWATGDPARVREWVAERAATLSRPGGGRDG